MKTDRFIDDKVAVQLLDHSLNVVKEFPSTFSCARFLGTSSLKLRSTKTQPFPTRKKRDTGEKFYVKKITQ